MDDELETLEQFIQESQKRFDSRRQFRERNTHDSIEYPNEVSLSKLDSSIKKNSAFVKRLKVFTESQKDQILNEIERLNLTKFTSEVAASIIEAKLKLSDIPSVVEICTKLNTTYKDFNKHLLEQFGKYFPVVRRKQIDSSSQSSSHNASAIHTSSNSQVNNQSGKVQAKFNDNVSLNPSKLRVDLRLFSELLICGIFHLKEGFPVLSNLLCYLMVYDKNSHQNANAILTFCKGSGDELLGLIPSRIQLIAKEHSRDLPVGDLIPLKRQEALKSHVVDYYQSLVKHFRNLHNELDELVIRNKRLYKSKGELSKECKELVDMKYSECQKFQNIVQQLADILDEPQPLLPDYGTLKEDTKETDGETENLPISEVSSNKHSTIWDDEGTRSFYEDLLELVTLFPNLTIKISTDKRRLASNQEDKIDEECGQAVEGGEKEPKEISEPGSRDSTPTKVPEDGGDELEKIISSSSSEESLNCSDETVPHSSVLSMSKSIANRTQPDQYFNKLSNCVNRDMIDNAAIDFIRFFNTKFGRRKLIKTLFNVQRTRLDLLPFFSRLTATLYPYIPNVGNELVALLKQDFRNLFRKKDQINIESKVKNVRFIGELVKFNLYSKQESLNCLKMLLSDFTHHHIEMTCNLLETCGRLLYKSNDSHHQLKLLLEQTMRKKLLLSVDSKYVTMIENAYYFTNPPDVVRHIVEEPQVHIYVRYLLCECLNRSTINKVLQKIKKLDWEDRSLAKFAIDCMIEAYNLKFYNIRYLAALLAALNKEHEWISVAVIDGVVEDILLMVEINELHFNQRRIPMIRYFGELYNYRLSDSSLVFKILYSLITYGVYYPESNQTLNQIPMSQLDLPDNLFRIKLVCDLLETCGQYLSSGQEKKKLDCYLLFFQRYYWYKRHIYMLHPYCLAKSGNQFPASIEYLYNDAIYNLRPTFQMATSYSEAIQSVQNFIDNLIVSPPPS